MVTFLCTCCIPYNGAPSRNTRESEDPMEKHPAYPVQVFYDGACPVCAREIRHYLRADRACNLIPVDISRPDFDPGRWGIPREAFMEEIHVIDRNGRVFRGIDGFRAIWLAFPGTRRYRLLAWLVSLTPINRIARLGYACFARLRHYLPSTTVDRCTGTSCSRSDHPGQHGDQGRL